MGLYETLWNVVLAIKLMVIKYKKFAVQYTTLAIYN